MKVLPAADRPLAQTLGLGPTLLIHAESDGRPWMAASLVEGPAVVLGAAQRAGRVVRLDACAAAKTNVLRRATAGTAVYVGERALVWTLACKSSPWPVGRALPGQIYRARGDASAAV